MVKFKFVGDPEDYLGSVEVAKIYDSDFMPKNWVQPVSHYAKYHENDWVLIGSDSYENLLELIIGWAYDKNLLKPENQLKQFAKMVSEVGELGDALIKLDLEGTIDAIGDVQVCLIILCEQLGLNPTECLESAYNVIKDRTGKNLNGTFIKD